MFQQLEDFGSSNAFEEAVVVMGSLDRLGESDWKEIGSIISITDLEMSFLLKIMQGEKLEGGAPGPDEGAPPDEGESDGLDFMQFCNDWLECVARASVGIFISRLLEISKLSVKGVEQLDKDLNYFLNVFGNLGLKPHPMLRVILDWINLSEQEVKDHLHKPVPKGPSIASIIYKIQKKIATARGILL